MTLRPLLTAAFVSALLIGGVAEAGDGLRFSETMHDFGKIVSLEKLPHKFIFVNKGGKTVSIVSVTPSCGCTAAVPDKRKYKPGEKGDITVTFDPVGKLGHNESTVTVQTSSGGKYVLTVSADIETAPPGGVEITLPGPAIGLSREVVDFGKIKLGKSYLYSVIVENRGDGDLLITNIGDVNDEGLPLNRKFIKKGKKVEITFYFTPEKKGPFEETAQITSNDPQRPVVEIRLTGIVE